ncbi:hypothetical protein, partial [Flavobacterium gelidilacus]
LLKKTAIVQLLLTKFESIKITKKGQPISGQDKTFKPPIKEKTTEELIIIANSSEKIWQKEAILQAKNELLVRNISEKQQEDFFDSELEKAEEYYKKVEEKRHQNLTESYSIITIIYIFIMTPFLLVSNWKIGLSLIQLKRENYLLKYKQRLITLIISIIVYTISIYFYVDYLNKKWETEINNIDNSEWERKYGYDK